MAELTKEKEIRVPKNIPLLPLRDVVVFPHMVIPLFVGRKKSILALEEATLNDRLILLVAQKNASIEEPRPTDIHLMGTTSEILQLLKLPDGTLKVLVEGLNRAQVLSFNTGGDYFKAEVMEFDERVEQTIEVEALMRTVKRSFEDYVKMDRRFPPDAINSVSKVEQPGRFADIVAAYLNLPISDRQRILEIVDPIKRLEELEKILYSEIEILEIEKKIQNRVRGQIERAQKEYYLNERLRAIQKELGRDQVVDGEIAELKKKAQQAKMPKDIYDKAIEEIERLQILSPSSSERAVVRNYLDWLLSLPWSKSTRDKLVIKKAEEILDRDHYGLRKVKERILEFLAVRKLAKKVKGPILCFVGPPGTGKTSVGKSIAEALDRKFIRLSLGGVRDEAEIRGHRRTYVGALPGRIIQSIKKAGSKNPVFLLDEVDKMSTDFRGDPSAALLEVLDPEQNSTFSDHFLEVPFDLSKVLFITTANVIYSIPGPLRDRMEVIDFPSYTEDEKLQIAKRFLVPKEIKEHGLSSKSLVFSKNALLCIIRRYTREAGVRNLEREIANVCRKVAKRAVEEGKDIRERITIQNIHKYLGPPRYKYGVRDEEDRIGVCTGLSWTPMGGDVMAIEVVTMPGRGDLTLTGKLGDVMKESARAALAYARSRSERYGLVKNFHKELDIHIHVPEGAISKDGPSAGITLCTALISALSNRPIRSDTAMTGEITLRGMILPVGGIKEKLFAAYRSGLRRVIMPKENEKDLVDIPRKVKRGLDVVLVSEMDDVLGLVLVKEKGRKGRGHKGGT
jgi:ATP-dependent Lon protease